MGRLGTKMIYVGVVSSGLHTRDAALKNCVGVVGGVVANLRICEPRGWNKTS